MSSDRRLYLLRPRGFCAGVARAIQILENLLKTAHSPIYVLHEIVHNEFVVDSFRNRNVHFVATPEDVPDNAVLVFSAHGVSRDIENKCSQRHLRIIDATCPLVKKNHFMLQQLQKKKYEIILVGHAQHQEMIGILGQSLSPIPVVNTIEAIKELPLTNKPLAYLTQTTLLKEDLTPLVDALKLRFPQIEGKGNICYATRNRQQIVREMAFCCDTLIVMGSSKSSNSVRLWEMGVKVGYKKSFLIAHPKELTSCDLTQSHSIALTAGASSPELLLTQTVELLKQEGWETIIEAGDPENINFPFPDMGSWSY